MKQNNLINKKLEIFQFSNGTIDDALRYFYQNDFKKHIKRFKNIGFDFEITRSEGLGVHTNLDDELHIVWDDCFKAKYFPLLGCYEITNGYRKKDNFINNKLSKEKRRINYIDFIKEIASEAPKYDKRLKIYVKDLYKSPLKKIIKPKEYTLPTQLIIKPFLGEINERLIRSVSEKPDLLYKIDPIEFEILIGEILKKFGYSIELTKATRDGGKDIIAHYHSKAASFLTFVECKQYKINNPVGVGIIRSVYGVQKMHKAHKSLITTTSYFTKDALSEQNFVQTEMDLADNRKLYEWLKYINHKYYK